MATVLPYRVKQPLMGMFLLVNTAGPIWSGLAMIVDGKDEVLWPLFDCFIYLYESPKMGIFTA